MLSDRKSKSRKHLGHSQPIVCHSQAWQALPGLAVLSTFADKAAKAVPRINHQENCGCSRRERRIQRNFPCVIPAPFSLLHGTQGSIRVHTAWKLPGSQKKLFGKNKGIKRSWWPASPRRGSGSSAAQGRLHCPGNGLNQTVKKEIGFQFIAFIYN